MLFQKRYLEQLDRDKYDELPRWAKRLVFAMLILGTIGRALLFILLAILLSRIVYDSEVRSGGVGQALEQLTGNTLGQIACVFIGVLLVIFGAFSCVPYRHSRCVGQSMVPKHGV